MARAWKMEKPCANCPFNEDGPGRDLRESLRPGRFDDITETLMNEGVFYCHKTVDYSEVSDDHDSYNGPGLVCAGALAFQEENGVSSNLQRVCERLDWLSGIGSAAS